MGGATRSPAGDARGQSEHATPFLPPVVDFAPGEHTSHVPLVLSAGAAGLRLRASRDTYAEVTLILHGGMCVRGVAVRLERLCVTNASSPSPTPAGVASGGGGGDDDGDGGCSGDGVRVEGAGGVLYADRCAFSGSPRQGVSVVASSSGAAVACYLRDCIVSHNGGCGVGAYGPGVRVELRGRGMRVCSNDMAGLSAVGGARIHVHADAVSDVFSLGGNGLAGNSNGRAAGHGHRSRRGERARRQEQYSTQVVGERSVT